VPSSPAELAERTFLEGVKRFEARDLMGAISLWRDAVRVDPNNAEYHMRLGSALCKNPRWTKEAESHLTAAVRLDPTNVDGLMALGDLYKDAHLNKRAEAQYRAVLRLTPTHAAARKGLTDLGFTDLPPMPRPKGSEQASGGLLSKLFKRK
jgi:Flp pilus assembly protein TadD